MIAIYGEEEGYLKSVNLGTIKVPINDRPLAENPDHDAQQTLEKKWNSLTPKEKGGKETERRKPMIRVFTSESLRPQGLQRSSQAVRSESRRRGREIGVRETAKKGSLRGRYSCQ